MDKPFCFWLAGLSPVLSVPLLSARGAALTLRAPRTPACGRAGVKAQLWSPAPSTADLRGHLLLAFPSQPPPILLLFFNVYCYTVTVVCLFSPSLHPITSHS